VAIPPNVPVSRIRDMADVARVQPSDGDSLVWSSSQGKWVPSAGARSTTAISAQPPSSPSAGTRWIDPVSGRESVWYTDGGGRSAWVEFGSEGDFLSLTAATTPLTLPSSPTVNQLIIHGRRKWRWDSQVWRLLSPPRLEGLASADSTISVTTASDGTADLSISSVPSAATLASMQGFSTSESTDARTALGLGSAATASSSDFAASSHTHPLSGLTQSGASAGQVPQWNGTAWAPATPATAVSDGDKGDITVSGSGSTWTIDAGAVGTSKLGGDITSAGKALLDDADAASQRTTLGLGTAATSASSDFAAASHMHTLGNITRSGANPGDVATWDGTSWVASVITGGISDGDKGDITVSAGGTVWTVDAGAISTSKLGGDITTAGKALLDDADASAQRTTLGLGSSATRNIGTGDGEVPAFDSLNRYPAGDGSLLYNISSGFLDELGRYPPGDGSQIYNVDADYIDGYTRQRITRAGWFHDWDWPFEDPYADPYESVCENVSFCGSLSLKATTFDGSDVFSIRNIDNQQIFSVTDQGLVVSRDGFQIVDQYGMYAVPRLFYTSSAPEGPNVGDRWIDSDTGEEFVYIYDGSGYQWMQPTVTPFFGGALGGAVSVTSSSHSCSATDFYIGVSYSGTVSITLPPSPQQGKVMVVKDEAGNAGDSSKNIVLYPADIGDTIEGAASISIKTNFGSLYIVYRSGWRIVSGKNTSNTFTP